MNITFYGFEGKDKLTDKQIEILKKEFKRDKLIFGEENLPAPNKIPSDIEVLSIFVHNYIDKKILDKLPKLKLIATRSTGYDHIDVDECKKRNIVVCNVPSYGENTVAEHAMALLLNLSKRVWWGIERTKHKHSFDLTGLRGHDLKGKTIGIIGAGKIGLHMVKYSKAFDTNVIVFDKFQNKELSKQYGFEYVSLDELFKTSDMISLHCPLTKETEHMINKNTIKKMKNGVIIINTARGGLIDEDALLQGLKSGKVAGAGLDVLEGEKHFTEDIYLTIRNKTELWKEHWKEVLKDRKLIDHPNVIVTPHNAWDTEEAFFRILQTTVDNINSFKKGKTQNIINT